MRGAVIAVLLLSHAAIADVVSPAPDAVRVTIYRPSNPTEPTYNDGSGEPSAGGLVMVSETRSVELPAGTSRIVFLGVADAIVPQTAAIEGLQGTIIESNFDYDLLTPGAVIAKSQGERVRLVRTDRKTGRTIEREAILRTGPQGIVLEIDGKTEALNCSGLDEKLVFPRIPPGLADEPRLSMTVRAAAAGRHTSAVELSRTGHGLVRGLCRAHRRRRSDLGSHGLADARQPQRHDVREHAGRGRRRKPRARRAGNATARADDRHGNFGVLADRPVRDVQRPRSSTGRSRRRAPRRRWPWDWLNASAIQEVAVTGSRVPLAAMRELGDYKLYAVPEPTTIAARQSKQVQFLNQARVPFTRVYLFKVDEASIMHDNDFMPRRPTSLLRLQNKKSDGLGKPLPAGVVSVMETGDAGPVLAGQDKVDDTPVGLPFELELGRAMDIWIEPRVTREETVETGDHDEQRVTIEVRLGNDKPVPVTLEYRQPSERENFRIVSESHSHILKEGTTQWTFRLRPGGRAILRYSMQRSD